MILSHAHVVSQGSRLTPSSFCSDRVMKEEEGMEAVEVMEEHLVNLKSTTSRASLTTRGRT